jgi:hypothetical protein
MALRKKQFGLQGIDATMVRLETSANKGVAHLASS